MLLSFLDIFILENGKKLLFGYSFYLSIHIVKGNWRIDSELFGLVANNYLEFYIKAFVISIFLKWVDSENKKVILAESASNSKLRFLRLQMSPHFLFNILNGIYSLSIINSERTQIMLQKLKSVLSYLNKTEKNDMISINEEIQYLTDYVDLNKERTAYPYKVKLDINNKSDSSKKIASMILIPFIENAFKHGSLSKKDDSLIIKLNIEADGFLEMTVTNSTVQSDTASKDKTRGIGLKNVKERLELLYEPSHINLKVNQTSLTHHVHLSIDHV